MSNIKKDDQAFSKAMHGEKSTSKKGFTAALSKDQAALDLASERYFQFFNKKKGVDENDEDREGRLADYAALTRHYYNLVTDFYEYGWGGSFHFCRYYPGEAHMQAIARHEHYLAYKMNIQAGMKVLDVGCGVGGPAREIARFTSANVVGLNNNDYQIERAQYYSKTAGLENQVTFAKGDFMNIEFDPETFDAVYAIEATVHAPSLEGVYGQIYKVLKPGGVFGVYEWVMTHNFDPENKEHREIRYGIEIGDGIPQMFSVDVAIEALKKVGFEIEYQEDLADRDDEIPWYYPLSGNLKYARSLTDLLTVFRVSRIGRLLTTLSVGALEKLRVAPKGSAKVTNALEEAAVNLVRGGEEKIFTPMMLFVARKPASA
ncbi:hypothetical protein CANCADRAFT_83603 [Tortispora caseinolytica NRRL Y-17796]|uniref:SAM-dependent methyltransferase Erg6/SMT-type domain-containing protein n=1 Tax=Tortispora caseinolytica NRRL Y-17796 TaxID=767744 RepID=A0A1E4TKD1_9ASCO|nr:hypothetical protein CANCADRAFT_83603 [Tortispora caseinolytica NRRL Y-17796]